MEQNSTSQTLQILDHMKKEGVFHFSLPDLDDKKVSLSDFPNHIILIHFWASWCEPCIKEWPSIMNLVKSFQGDLVLMAISLDPLLEEINTFLLPYQKEIKSLPFIKILQDSKSQISTRYGVSSIPESYIVGPRQKLLRKMLGAQDWESQESLSFFQYLIQKHLQKRKKSIEVIQYDLNPGDSMIIFSSLFKDF